MAKTVSFESLEWMLGKCDDDGRMENDDKTRRRMQTVLRKAISGVLTPLQKEVVLLYYYGKKTMPEIARMRGCHTSNISRTLARARRNLAFAMQFVPSLRSPREF